MALASEDHSDEYPTKRRRIALACNVCRTRKSKCDGQRPTCSSCKSSNTKSYFTTLEQQVKDLSTKAQRHDDLLLGHLSKCSNPTSSIEPSPQPILEITASSNISSMQVEEESETRKIDGLALTFFDENSTILSFGPSSNMALSRSLVQVFGQQRIDPPKMSILVEQSLEPELSQYPGINEMEALINKFFDSTGLLFPFLHKPSFMRTFQDFRTDTSIKAQRSWLAILNMVFALGIANDDLPITERAEQASVYYSRARKICNTLFIQTTNLNTIQYLLLVVLYLQSTHLSVQMWNLHGILVSSAIALGLHIDHPREKTIENEIRRRTWYSIYILDKFMSTTFGRPSLINDEHVNPIPLEWPEGSSISCQFLLISVELFQIMSTCVATQYNGNIPGEDLDHLKTIEGAYKTKQDLRRWASKLPSDLHLLPALSITDISSKNRLRVSMTLRYHNLNMLIHRPMLCIVLDYWMKGIQDIPYTIQSCMNESIECLRSAGMTIDIIYSLFTTGRERNTGAWWFALYYIFSASLIIGGRLTWAQKEQDEMHTQLYRSQLVKAFNTIELLDTRNTLVKNCSSYVSSLLKLLGYGPVHELTTAEMLSRVGGQGLSTLPELESPQGLDLERFLAFELSRDPFF